MNKIIAVELSFATAPKVVCERASKHTQNIPGLHEKFKKNNSPYFILNTCRRLAVFTASSCPDKSIHFFEDLNIHKKYLKIFRGSEAVQHLLAVSGGLKSPCIGETEILHQLKNVLKESNELKTLNISLQRLLQKAIETGKRIRTETSIAHNNISYPAIVQDILKEHGVRITESNILIIGNGKLGNSCIRYFLGKNARITLATRNPEKVTGIDKSVKIITRNDIGKQFPLFDVIIGAASTSRPLITKDQIEKSEKIPLLVDLAVPANFDQKIQLVKENIWFNLDYIFEKSNHLKDQKSTAIEKADKIVAEETDTFSLWLKSRKAVNIINTLKEELELIKSEEHNRLLDDLGDVNMRQKKIIDNLVNRLTSRIAHTHYSHIKNFVVNEQS